MMTSRKLYPLSLNDLQWRGNSASFTWQIAGNLVQSGVETSTTDTLLRTSELNVALASVGGEKVKRMPAITWQNESKFNFSQPGKLYSFDMKTRQASLLTTYIKEAENIDIAPVTNYVAYTRGNNLSVSCNNVENTVTNDTDKGIVNGQKVHRNEFGIEKGTFWSPSGKLLAFYRMDQTMVTDYPLVDIEPRIAALHEIKYPMAGMASHHVTVGVYNPESHKVVFLNTGEPAEQYLTNITWSPDEKSIYIAVLNRDQNHLWLRQYDATTGDFIKTLFEETNDRYVEPLHCLYFLPGHPDKFVWQSQRDGFNHFYLYNAKGELVKQITRGNWVVTKFLGMDAYGSTIYYTSTQESPIENQVYSVEMKSGKIVHISSGHGTHTTIIRADGKYFLDKLSSTSIASRYTLLTERGRELRVIKEDINPLKDYKIGETTIFTIKAGDSADLYCRLIKPTDFDPGKKYPAIIYVYGGPHEQLVKDSWLGGAGLFLNWLAEKGYVVFTLDNHGSQNRGFDFESIIHRQAGTIEMSDQMKGVEYLKSLGFVNPARIGVDGWSYGGFMAITMKLNHPEVFKVATAGGPVIDWKFYEVMYGERYMDMPQQNPEGYAKASLLDKADKLEGKLLIIQGTMDSTVVWQNSLQFIQKCIEAGKQVDYFVYPGHEHNVSGIDRAHLYRKIAGYYDANL
ncbi:MAG TPA: DPP IV N-terminal domain-containing protein, partial [Bacteroidales bacterium]